MQQRLKSPPGSARAEVIAAEFLDQFLVPAHHAITAFYLGFRGKAFPTLATDLESTRGRGVGF
jgi:hypothetical protein